MSNNGAFFISSQLVTQAPMLMVYLVTLVVAIVTMRRTPLPSALALVGTLVLMACSVVFPALQWFLLRQGSSNLPSIFGFIAVLTNCLRAAGTALLVSAIFVGRGRTNTGSQTGS